MQKTENDIWEIVVPPEVAVLTDKKTNVKSVAFPINFPDGTHGYLTLTKLTKWSWQPSQDIQTIAINWK